MTTFFSPSIGGFFSTEIHGSVMPEDVLEISEDLHQQLLQGQSSGLEIVAGPDGNPVSQPRPVSPLAERQQRAWDAIARERDRRIQTGGFMVAGYWYHSDTFSRTQHLGMLIAGPNLPANLLWKTMNGSFVLMTPSVAQQVFASAAASDPLVFIAAETHKAQMMSAPDPQAYTFLQGWPVNFSDLFPNG